MENIFVRTLQKLLAISKLELSRMTPKEQVVAFIQKLHPYRTDKKLIRVGPNTDGGYLLPDDLKGIQACFSPGVDTKSEFELWCFNNGMEIYLADKSVEKVNLDISPENYSFIKKFVGSTNNETYITLDEWVNSSIEEKTSDLLLQMDIEGGEYDTLLSTSDALMNRFRIIIIEFHSLQKLWDRSFFHFADLVINKILQTHYCVHIHPNNLCGIDSRVGIEIPVVAEFTFLRKDRVSTKAFETSFPHSLDFDNTDSPPMPLPKIWYSKS